MKNYRKILLVATIILVSSCNLNDNLQDPNQVSSSSINPDTYLNGIQLSFGDFFNRTSSILQQLVRMQAMTGGYRYTSAIQAQTMDELWQIAYQKVLVNIETVLPEAQRLGLNTHIGVAKIIKAYVYLTLVDLFDNVPKSEALLAAGGNFNPKPQDGESIYNESITLLNEAIVSLEKSGSLTRDIYYDGNKDNWIALANTLALKAYVNLSLLPSRSTEANNKIDELLKSNIIDNEDESFTYKYGTATVPSNSRHPLYDQFYKSSSGSASGYIGNYFLYQLYNGIGVQDPRWRYYFYRQVGSVAWIITDYDPAAIGCSKGNPPATYANYLDYYCVFEPGFYGRDHGDGSGTPPDSEVITCAGVYPAGGMLDTNNGDKEFNTTTIRGDGANGAGIEPIWMAFYTDYLKAEILARRSLNAKSQLLFAVKNSINQIRSFSISRKQILDDNLEPSSEAYTDRLSNIYDGAVKKIDPIGREFYVALWGNGIEAFNLYRRTSTPKGMPPTLQANPGPFYRSLLYPSNFVNLNSSSGGQRDVSKKVFWDTNPDNLN